MLLFLGMGVICYWLPTNNAFCLHFEKVLFKCPSVSGVKTKGQCISHRNIINNFKLANYQGIRVAELFIYFLFFYLVLASWCLFLIQRNSMRGVLVPIPGYYLAWEVQRMYWGQFWV